MCILNIKHRSPVHVYSDVNLIAFGWAHAKVGRYGIIAKVFSAMDSMLMDSPGVLK